MDQTLRPMSTGQVLDRTFSLYRDNFLLFAGIAALPPAFVLVAQVIGFLVPKAANTFAGSTAGIATLGFGVVVAVILYVIGSTLATGASVYAVSNAHLGKPRTIGMSYRAVSGRVLAMIGTSICMGLLFFVAGMAVFVPFAVLTPLLGKVMGNSSLFIMIPVGAVAFVFLIKFFLRCSLAVPACVLEKTGPIESIKRSLSLAKGAEGRLFLILLLFFAIVMVLTLVFSIPTFIGLGIAATKGGQPPLQYAILQALGSFIASTLSGPIYTISFALIYYDQRVRKEAFDLTLMMEAIGQAPPPMQMGASAGSPTSIG